MADKAYIVANEEQEREVLIDLENQGYVWDNFINSKPTTMTYQDIDSRVNYPYVLYANDDTHKITWGTTGLLNDTGIVYDGRKESKVKISKEVYDALGAWRENSFEFPRLKDMVGIPSIEELPDTVIDWWADNNIDVEENNNRLIAIIRWVNGEDVFEVDKPKKWVVRSKGTDFNNHYHYAILAHAADLAETYYFTYTADGATKFDTREEAESWANAHQEVIEVEE